MLWRTYFVILYIVAATANEFLQQEWLDVTIAQGTVRGYRDPTEDLFIFYNVPYATAPTGVNKFKAPLPPANWTDTYEAINKWIICPQAMDLPQQEDCLVANVYVPDRAENNLSVLVYTHGGGFHHGYGDMGTYKNLMRNRDIIVITFNYRLGPHGFLCLGTDVAPGNAGLKDQVALLRWVKQNIAAFGGNPNDVTLAGYSAGSASVDLLMISKSAEGLFHKVIPESGANVGIWAVVLEPLENAKNFARDLNFTNVDDIRALEQFYTSLPYNLLMSGASDYPIIFAPCIERHTFDEPLITEAPLNVLKRGDYNKLPLLYGFANMEGLILIDSFDISKDKMNKKFSDFLPEDLQFESTNVKEEVAQQVKEFYFGDQPVDTNTILQYIDYYTDTLIAYSQLRAVKLHVEAGHDKVYLYEYSFVDNDTPVVPYTDVRGADHGAQSMAVADGINITHSGEEDITEEYRTMKRIIREMWYNFIKTGKPVPEASSLPAWPAAGADRSPHMSLGPEIILDGILLDERASLWDNIYEKYYRLPTPPPSSAADLKERFIIIFVFVIFFWKLF